MDTMTSKNENIAEEDLSETLNAAAQTDADEPGSSESANSEQVDSQEPSLSEDEQQIQQLSKALETEKETAKEAQEKMLRTLAEFENFKKRKEQEKEEAIKFSLKSFFQDFLPVLDSFDQAENVFKEVGSDQEALKNGVQLIQQQLYSLLEKNGVVKIDASDQVFDPNLHQAVMQEEVDGVASQTIIRVMQEGYLYHDRVLRPAMVVVAS